MYDVASIQFLSYHYDTKNASQHPSLCTLIPVSFVVLGSAFFCSPTFICVVCLVICHLTMSDISSWESLQCRSQLVIFVIDYCLFREMSGTAQCVAAAAANCLSTKIVRYFNTRGQLQSSTLRRIAECNHYANLVTWNYYLGRPHMRKLKSNLCLSSYNFLFLA